MAVATTGQQHINKESKVVGNDPQQTTPIRNKIVETAKEITPQAVAAPTSSNTRDIGKTMASEIGWVGDQWICLEKLWTKESNWRTEALNRSSGATGIPQALPGEKMASAGSDWKSNPSTQIRWGLGYIKARYSTPCNAWSHSQQKGWY